jgi:SOS-response transcriptional repressor LexA
VSWAKLAIEALQRGERAQVRPRGHSMRGKVEDGDPVVVEPCPPEKLSAGDIVLVRVKGSVYLHLIKAIDGQRFLIGNNRGGINGWVGPNAIYGVATQVAERQVRGRREQTG